MITSKSCANYVLSIKSDKRFLLGETHVAVASASLPLAVFCVRASCGGVYCRFCGQTSRAGRSSWVKNRASVPSLINAFLALDFALLTYLDN